MAAYTNSYNNQINARALIGQSAVGYCADKPTEKSLASTELLYKSNRPQVSMVYELINHLGCWYSAARGLQILLVFYQHPAWFSKFSAPTIAFLAFLLAKKLRI